MSQPLVSVIMPIYNGADFVATALQSIDHQTYDQIEVIIIDDGSSDATQAVINKTSIRFPIRLESQTNQGPAAARNRGIALATGELVAFLDADDTWLPNKIAAQVQPFEQSSAIGVVFANAERKTANGTVVGDFFSGTAPQAGQVTKALLHQNFIPLLTAVVRVSLLKQIGGFDANLRTSEDYDAWIRLSQLTEFAFIPEVLATYLVRPDSESANQRRLLDSDIQVLLKFVQASPDLAQKFSGTIANHLHLHLIVYSLIDRVACRRIYQQFGAIGLRHWKLTYVYLSTFLPHALMVMATRSARIENEMHAHEA